MKLSWGKPRLFAKEEGGNSWVELATPVEGSTELQTTKGDKLEAKIEGGLSEESRYKDSSYAVVYNIRKLKGRTSPFKSKNGVVSKHHSFLLMPEDSSNLGFYIEDTTVSVDDTFNAADGANWAFRHEALAAKTGNTVKWGTVTITTNTSATISFVETDPADGCEALTLKASPVTLAK